MNKFFQGEATARVYHRCFSLPEFSAELDRLAPETFSAEHAEALWAFANEIRIELAEPRR